MKKISALVLLASMSSPALAEARDFLSRNGIPVYQLGSGQRAGGPASELNVGNGRPVLRPGAAASRAYIPAYQRGSGQRAGGPANELNTNGRAAFPDRSVAELQGIPAYQLGSGQRAGGPASELNTSGFPSLLADGGRRSHAAAATTHPARPVPRIRPAARAGFLLRPPLDQSH